MDRAPDEGSRGYVRHEEVPRECEIGDGGAFRGIDEDIRGIAVEELFHADEETATFRGGIGVAEEGEGAAGVALRHWRKSRKRLVASETPAVGGETPVEVEGEGERRFRGRRQRRGVFQRKRLREGEDEIADGELAVFAEDLVDHLLELAIGEFRAESEGTLPIEMGVEKKNEGLRLAGNRLVRVVSHVLEEIVYRLHQFVGID